MSLISAIVPCFNEQEAIPFFYEEMLKTIDVFKEKYPDVIFEMLFIDDGSKDKTLESAIENTLGGLFDDMD